MREQITATTNKVEAYNGFAKWLNFGGEGVIDTIDPVEQEKHLKYNHLVANAAAIQNVIDLTRAVRTLQADGYIIQRDDLAQLSPYQTRRLKDSVCIARKARRFAHSGTSGSAGSSTGQHAGRRARLSSAWDVPIFLTPSSSLISGLQLSHQG